MYFLKFAGEVTGGETIGLIVFLLFAAASAGLVSKLGKEFKPLHTRGFFIGIISYIVISMFIFDVFIRLLFFPGGEYVNYGAVKGMVLLTGSIAAGTAFGFFLTKKVFFNYCHKV